GIEFLDQIEFPGAAPALQNALSVPRFENRRILLVVDEHDEPILARKARHDLSLVFREAAHKIIRYSDIEHATFAVSKNVNEISIVHHGSCPGRSAARPLRGCCPL